MDLFISYSHSDKKLYDLFAQHLKPLQYEGLISPWSDREIMPGAEFDKEITSQLNKAAIILLLVSPAFVASKYCWGIEMTRAMARHEAGTARVIPIILRPVDWHNCPFGKLLALPTDGKPVTSWAHQDEAFLDIVKSIRSLVTKPIESHPKAASKAQDLGDAEEEETELKQATVMIVSQVSTDCDIFVDDVFCKEIGANGTAQIKVDPGEHFIQLFGFPRQKSNRQFFRASSGEVIQLEVSLAGNSWMGGTAAAFGMGEMYVLKMRK